MKRCSFTVAKAIKEAGYPQEVGEGDIYFAENGLTWEYDSETYELYDDIIYCVRPTYLDVWLWLWREKDVKIDLDEFRQASYIYINGNSHRGFNYTDPEEAISGAIEYLVKNKLLKKI